jgi:hypothetical protein
LNERGPDGLLNGKSPGQPSKLNDVQRQAIVRIIESGPIPAVHGLVRWRLIAGRVTSIWIARCGIGSGSLEPINDLLRIG